MSYDQLAAWHLGTVLPAFVLATAQFAMPKGTPLHRSTGRVFMLLMLVTAAVTLFMPAHVGPRFLGHFGFIHLLSLLTFVSVPRGFLAARRGDIAGHRKHMLGLYIGALLIAGAFALMPGRRLHHWLFG